MWVFLLANSCRSEAVCHPADGNSLSVRKQTRLENKKPWEVSSLYANVAQDYRGKQKRGASSENSVFVYIQSQTEGVNETETHQLARLRITLMVFCSRNVTHCTQCHICCSYTAAVPMGSLKWLCKGLTRLSQTIASPKESKVLVSLRGVCWDFGSISYIRTLIWTYLSGLCCQQWAASQACEEGWPRAAHDSSSLLHNAALPVCLSFTTSNFVFRIHTNFTHMVTQKHTAAVWHRPRITLFQIWVLMFMVLYVILDINLFYFYENKYKYLQMCSKF